ncbi:hypothetical protein BC835DRAFT_1361475 [Cytidiella melzeri]|nr:hypothetical protein BC835DRAFT_1361475 [Cytidiella melzeri]
MRPQLNNIELYKDPALPPDLLKHLMPALRNSLDIRLAESVVFLRTGDGTGRVRHGTQPLAPPAMVRGLLTLDIVKPTKISSIEIEFVGKASSSCPEGLGSRGTEVSEDRKVHSQHYVLFKAGSNGHSAMHTRTMSVGPGLHLEHDDQDDHTDESSENEHGAGDYERRGREPTRGRQRERPLPRQLSADQTNFQSGFVSHRNEQVPTPPYSDSPAYSRSATPSAMTPLDSPSISRRVSFDEASPAEFIAGNSTGHAHPAPSYSSDSSRGTFRSTGSPHPHDDRGRRNRTSIGLFMDTVREKVRSVSRAAIEPDTPSHMLTLDTTVERAASRDSSKTGRTRERREHPGLERVREVVGIESEEVDESGVGWKEFRKGVYTYPISFVIPPGSPPSMLCEYGALTWKLKACAHRPGTFTSKLSAGKEVTVVTCPSEDDTEESESIVVDRPWDTQMQYFIVISGRSFPVGASIPFSITFAPWTKMKIFRLQVVLEERVDYYAEFKKLMRTDPIKRVILLNIKDHHKDHPILPLCSDDIQAFKGSALYGSAGTEDALSETIANLMGPGPWNIHKNLQLPNTCDDLHFTNKNKRANMTVTHTLKVIFRVQRGDDEEVDAQTGKRKMFDIVVQTPIHILSCLCNPDYTALPPYSELQYPVHAVTSVARCQCPPRRPGLLTPVEPTALRSSDAQTPTSPLGPSRHHTTPTQSAHHSYNNHTRTVSQAHSGSRTPLPHMDSMIQRSIQYERLVAGLESELGEAPPAYEQATVA